MKVLNTTRKLIIASALSTMMIASSSAYAFVALSSDNMMALVQTIKTDLLQHPGVIGGYDMETGVVTLTGQTDEAASINRIIAKIKTINGVTDVKSYIMKP